MDGRPRFVSRLAPLGLCVLAGLLVPRWAYAAEPLGSNMRPGFETEVMLGATLVREYPALHVSSSVGSWNMPAGGSGSMWDVLGAHFTWGQANGLYLPVVGLSMSLMATVNTVDASSFGTFAPTPPSVRPPPVGTGADASLGPFGYAFGAELPGIGFRTTIRTGTKKGFVGSAAIVPAGRYLEYDGYVVTPSGASTQATAGAWLFDLRIPVKACWAGISGQVIGALCGALTPTVFTASTAGAPTYFSGVSVDFSISAF
jgi:hypothetical protein